MNSMYYVRKMMLATVTLLVSISFAAKADDLCSTPVTTRTGQVSGMADMASKTCAWLGMPYAAPPVGENRWRAPQPAVPWSGVRETKAFGQRCMQSGGPMESMSEDCLTLNIWRPDKPGKFPVMIFIHGGAYVVGWSKDDLGGKLAEFGDVIVITFDYRLGAFGFLATPALREEDPDKSAGSYGSLDQIAALKWVHDNIANFGGDPSNITIFGQSAGGWSVCTLLASPLAKGLFSRAIIESGGCESTETLDQGYATGAIVAKKVGCKVDDLKCLRAVPAEKLVVSGADDIFKKGFVFFPHEDGHLLTGTPLSIIRSGNFNKVPLLAGSNKEEINAVVKAVRPWLYYALPFQYESRIIRNLNVTRDEAKNVEQAYPLTKYNNRPGEAFGYILTDMLLACPTYFGLESFAGQAVPAYYYRFDYRGMENGSVVGAMHTMEVPLVFNSFGEGSKFKTNNIEQTRELSRIIQGYWTNFAKTGNPNGPNLPVWPRFEPNHQAVQILDTQVRTEQSDSRPRCAPWDGYPQTHTPAWKNLGKHEKHKR